jgi:hypothetical protein
MQLFIFVAQRPGVQPLGRMCKNTLIILDLPPKKAPITTASRRPSRLQRNVGRKRYRLSITYNGSSRSFTRVFSIIYFSPSTNLILFLFVSHRPSVLFSTTCFFAACFFLYRIASSLLTNYPSIFFLSEGPASHTLLPLLASSLYHIQGTSPHIPLLHPLPLSLFGVGLPPISPSALDC